MKPTRATVTAVFSLSAAGILANTLILPVLPDIAADLDIGDGAIGLIVSAASFPGIFVAPVIGLLADRFGRRAVAIPCLVVFGVAGVLGGLAPNFAVLLALRLLQGVGAAGLINLAVVVVGDLYTGSERARMIGLNAVVITLGLSVFPTLGGAIGDTWGWRASFIPYAAAFLVALLATRALPADRHPDPPTVGEQLRSAGAFMRNGRVAAMAATGFLAFVAVFGVAVTLPIHLSDEFGSSAVVRGLMLAIPAAGAGVVSLSMGRLSERFSVWDLVWVGFALLGVAYMGVGVAPVVLVVALPAFAYGMGESLTIVPMQDYATTLAPNEHRGLMVAVWVSAVRAGQTVGPAAAGAAIAAFGTGGAFLAGTVLAAGCTAFVLSVRGRLVRLDRLAG